MDSLVICRSELPGAVGVVLVVIGVVGAGKGTRAIQIASTSSSCRVDKIAQVTLHLDWFAVGMLCSMKIFNTEVTESFFFYTCR